MAAKPLKSKRPQEQEFTFVDMCCGIGAFHMALRRLGGTCVLACDRSKKSRETYEANHGATPWHEDLYTLREIPRVDLFCAGFPCTTFSTSGKRLGTTDPDAGRVIFHLIKLLRRAVASGQPPQAVILENVPGLISSEGGKTLTYIQRSLSSLGYAVSCELFDASDFGAPMNRVRLIIVGTRGFALEGGPTRARRPAVVADFLVPDSELEGDEVLKKEKYELLATAERYEHDGKHFAGFIRQVNYPAEDMNKMSAHSQALKIFDASGRAENFTSAHRYAFLVREAGSQAGVVRYLSSREMYSCMGFPKTFKLHPSGRHTQLLQLSNSINGFMLRSVCEWVIKSWQANNISPEFIGRSTPGVATHTMPVKKSPPKGAPKKTKPGVSPKPKPKPKPSSKPPVTGAVKPSSKALPSGKKV